MAVAAPMVAASGPTVLFVDDSRTVRLMGGRILESMGCRVVVAEGGYEALSLLEGGIEVDFVITDVVMPRLSGIAFVRQAARLLEVPILVVSVEDSDSVKQELLAAGACAVLPKPLEKEALFRVMKPLIEGRFKNWPAGPSIA